MAFAERFKKLREERKLGFSELADMVNVHSTQLRRYEKGESQPTLDVLRKLATALNVPGDMLLFDENERKPPEEFILQFEALSSLNQEDIQTIKAIIEGLLIRRQASKWTNK